RPRRREGRDGCGGPVRRTGAGAARATRPGRSRARGAARVRVTDSRALLEEISIARLVGTPNHARVREILKRELQARGFVVLEQRFRTRPRLPLWGRAASDAVNLIAVRPRARVTAWLTAHYDSKGQAVSMAARLVLAGVAVAGSLGAIAARLAGGPPLVLAVPGVLVAAVVEALAARRARLLPVLEDGLVLAGGVRECVTLMRGCWATARVVHTPRDTAERLTLVGVQVVAAAVADALRDVPTLKRGLGEA